MKKEKKEAKLFENSMREKVREYKHNRRLKVNDDWSPNFPNNEVGICTQISWLCGHGRVIQSVYGMDDTSVERIYHSDNIDELIEKWKAWKEFSEKIPQVTNKKWFLDRGFEWG